MKTAKKKATIGVSDNPTTTLADVTLTHSDSFEPGQAVMLKSGGPGMTVIDVGRYSGIAVCVWSIDGTIVKDLFDAATIEIDSRPPQMRL